MSVELSEGVTLFSIKVIGEGRNRRHCSSKGFIKIRLWSETKCLGMLSDIVEHLKNFVKNSDNSVIVGNF